mmetsp:Transcript_91349/g.293390  ORF Transcript_91349/g.293390 Transcript_91349/m.293390 type:complete len:215 (-) Transcript_91349:442-1086(-)
MFERSVPGQPRADLGARGTWVDIQNEESGPIVVASRAPRHLAHRRREKDLVNAALDAQHALENAQFRREDSNLHPKLHRSTEHFVQDLFGNEAATLTHWIVLRRHWLRIPNLEVVCRELLEHMFSRASAQHQLQTSGHLAHVWQRREVSYLLELRLDVDVLQTWSRCCHVERANDVFPDSVEGRALLKHLARDEFVGPALKSGNRSGGPAVTGH